MTKTRSTRASQAPATQWQASTQGTQPAASKQHMQSDLNQTCQTMAAKRLKIHAIKKPQDHQKSKNNHVHQYQAMSNVLAQSAQRRQSQVNEALINGPSMYPSTAHTFPLSPSIRIAAKGCQKAQEKTTRRHFREQGQGEKEC